MSDNKKEKISSILSTYGVKRDEACKIYDVFDYIFEIDSEKRVEYIEKILQLDASLIFRIGISKELHDDILTAIKNQGMERDPRAIELKQLFARNNLLDDLLKMKIREISSLNEKQREEIYDRLYEFEKRDAGFFHFYDSFLSDQLKFKEFCTYMKKKGMKNDDLTLRIMTSSNFQGFVKLCVNNL